MIPLPSTVPLAAEFALPKTDLDALRAKGTAQLCVSVWRDAAGFPDKLEAAAEAKCVRAEDWKFAAGTQRIQVDLGRYAAGEIAVAAFLDLDGDGNLRKNFFGMPQEPYGFSGNPRIRFAAPEFKETKLSLVAKKNAPGENAPVEIKLAL